MAYTEDIYYGIVKMCFPGIILSRISTTSRSCKNISGVVNENYWTCQFQLLFSLETIRKLYAVLLFIPRFYSTMQVLMCVFVK